MRKIGRITLTGSERDFDLSKIKKKRSSKGRRKSDQSHTNQQQNSTIKKKLGGRGGTGRRNEPMISERDAGHKGLE